jgi:hypothetical protein
MKKTLLVLVALLSVNFFIGCAASEFGSEQADNRIYQAGRQIEEKESILGSLEKNLADSTMTYSDKVEIRQRIAEIKVQIYDLAKLKDKIALDYISSSGIPDELTPSEKIRRQIANIVKREAMVIAKINKNLSSTEATADGYKVILDNQYYMPITFAFSSLNGGERTAFNLESGKKATVYLLPGTYEVTFLSGGTQIGIAQKMTIDGQKRVYQGEECFNFAYMPSR